MSKLNSINSNYNSLIQSRQDHVYHYYWAVDSGESRLADDHEKKISDIDEQLNKLKLEYVSTRTS